MFSFRTSPTEVQRDMLLFAALFAFVLSLSIVFCLMVMLNTYSTIAIAFSTILFSSFFIGLLCSLIVLITFTILFATGFMADYE